MKKISETTNSQNKNSEQDISHEVEPTNTTNSQENIENNDIEREEYVTIQNQEIFLKNNVTQSFKEKHTCHGTKANNSKTLVNQKSVVILGDSMTKLLNGWEWQREYNLIIKSI